MTENWKNKTHPEAPPAPPEMLAKKELGPLGRLRRRLWLEQADRDFIRHNRRKWPQAYGQEGVILVDLFDWNPFIYLTSYVAHFLARHHHAEIHAFTLADGWSNLLGLPVRRERNLFASFGARLCLRKTWLSTWRLRREARHMAQSLRDRIHSKRDLVAVEIKGLRVGHLIYDAYLRRESVPTIDLASPLVYKYLFRACLTFLLVERYFDTHRVKAVVTTHFDYIEHGILTVIASARGVPVFLFFDDTKFLLREVGVHNGFQRRLFWRYREEFAKLPAEQKRSALEQAKQVLEQRLAGKPDAGVTYLLKEGTPTISGYGAPLDQPALKNTGKPRILILLHCFFDSPHVYRDMLFPDIWEWLDFLLSRARENKQFDWYVKPHPQGRLENDAIVAEFRQRYPEVNFLERTSSNRQLLQEGIAALFTIYGTAGHEFAYRGVPVVNAGDNPHVGYQFNFHPQSVAELETLITKAGHLSIDIHRDEILEFFYMHYIDSFHENPFGARCIDASDSYEELGWAVTDSSIFTRYMAHENPEKNAKIAAYLESYFAPFLGLQKRRP